VQVEAVAAEASVRASGDITVSIARGLDFTGPITVTVEGLPAGVTASALTIATGQTSGTVTITASGAAVAGKVAMTLHQQVEDT